MDCMGTTEYYISTEAAEIYKCLQLPLYFPAADHQWILRKEFVQIGQSLEVPLPFEKVPLFFSQIILTRESLQIRSNMP